MKFVHLTLLCATTIASSGAFAQSAPSNQAAIDSDVTLLRSDLQADKTAIVTKEMQLTDTQGTAFWPLYREYTNKEQIVGDQRVKLIKDYADSYSTMDDSTADGLMKRYLKYEQDRLKLRTEYYPKFKKVAGSKAAAKFMQIDNRLNMLVDLQLSASIPIVE